MIDRADNIVIKRSLNYTKSVNEKCVDEKKKRRNSMHLPISSFDLSTADTTAWPQSKIQ